MWNWVLFFVVGGGVFLLVFFCGDGVVLACFLGCSFLEGREGAEGLFIIILT